MTLKEDFQIVRYKINFDIRTAQLQISVKQSFIEYAEATLRILDAEERILSKGGEV